MVRPGAARAAHLHAHLNVLIRGTVVVLAAAMAGHAGWSQQSVRLVPSISRFAGDGTSNPTSDAIAKANTIPLSAPTYVTADGAGNVSIADTGDNCIRRVDTAGNMTVLVGQPTSGSDTCQNASSVTASSAASGVLQPSGVAVDANGNLFIADTGHNCVRRLSSGGAGIAALTQLVGTCGAVSTASAAPAPAGLAVDAAGNLYIAINDAADGIYQVIRASASNGSGVCVVSGNTSAAVPTQCAGITGGVVLDAPQGLALDPIGNLYIADSGNACVREISGGAPSTAVGKCTNDGSTGSISTALQKPVSVISDAVGHLYITDNTAGQVFEALNGKLDPVGGNGLTGPYDSSQEGKAAISVSLLNPQGLGADSAGNLYLADTNNNIVRILSQGLRFPETNVSSHSQPQTLWFVITAAVNLTSGPGGGDWQVYQNQNDCRGVLPAPTPGQVETCKISLQYTPTAPGMRTASLTLTDSAASPSGVYRFGLSGVGKGAEAIFNPGTIKTLAGSLASPSAIAIDNAGDVYYAEAGTGSGNGSVSVLAAGSATPATLIAAGAGAASPQALALDPAGNLFIADATTNSILRYDTSGIVTTAVSGLTNPVALVVDPLDNIYVAENGATPGILKIYAGGQKTFIAGQGTQAQANNVPATTAKFVQLSALYMDPSGNIYVADRGAFRVYQIDTSGTIHTFAGTGNPTDGASPRSPLGIGLPGIAGLGADPAGDIYIADSASNRLVLVFSGVPQSAAVSVLAGTGSAGYTGDNGPANVATLNSPAAVAVDSAGEVFLADTGNSALREITNGQPTLDFGKVKIGTTSAPKSTTIWNVGNDDLQPLPGQLGDTTNFAFDGAGSDCPTNLSAGDTCIESFVCNPKSQGSFSTQYAQTAGLLGGTQAALLCVAPPPPQTNLTAAAVTVVYGNAYTLAATITGNQTTAPTGMATISINGTAVCPAASLPTNGAVSCTPSPTLKDVGTYTVTVSYSGDTNYPASNNTFTLTVTPRPVTITADNQTRPVNTQNPTLTGTVVNVVPGQSITAAFSTTATTASPAGTYPIAATSFFGAGTSPADYTVTIVNGTLTITSSGTGGGGGGGGGGSTTGSFTLTAAPPEQEIDHQGSVNYPVSLVSTGGFSGTVALSCSGLPEGAGCSFSTPNVTLGAGATVASIMTITATADSTNVPTLFSSTRPGSFSGPMEPHGSPSPLLAWTMLPLGLGGSAGTLFFGRGARRRRQIFLLLPFALLLVLGVSGCASPSNYKVYAVTISGSGISAGAPVKSSATVDLVLAR